ncbi:MAG TPA: hypothetical protein VFV47_10160 [Hyphomicrobiaceae bacterium]|nr:hypothetical protein [Hyphomicrobiaceae bacterium]
MDHPLKFEESQRLAQGSSGDLVTGKHVLFARQPIAGAVRVRFDVLDDLACEHERTLCFGSARALVGRPLCGAL